MRKILVILFVGTLSGDWGCHPAPKKIPSEGPITFNEFRQYFPRLELPYRFSADSLYKTEPDSAAIPTHVIRQFFPDSAFRITRGERFYPKGISEENGLYYFIMKTKSSGGRGGYLTLFDKKGGYLGALKIASAGGNEPDEIITSRIDRRYTVSLTYERKEANPPQAVTREDVYAPNPNGSFSLILTNTTQPAGSRIINPIDTLPRRHQFSGNYTNGKLNLVSIRDGAAPGRFRFYIHFNRGRGDCTGELEGTARFTGPSGGEYHEEAGPCGIRFDFTSTTVSIREIGGCGAYRGMKCLFEGVFRKSEKRKAVRREPRHINGISL